MKTLVLSMISIAATVAAMTACTSESDPIDEVVNPKDAKVEIKLKAGVIGIETKAAITKDDTFDATIIGWEGEESPAKGTAQTWITTAKNISGGASDATITLEDKQYYNPDGKKTFIRGYFPSGTPTTGKVTFENTTGSVDVILSDLVDAGTRISSGKNPAITFSHKLSQLKMNIKKDATLTDDVTLTSITVKNAEVPTGFDIISGTIDYAAAANIQISNINSATINAGENFNPAGDAIMIKPISSTTQITLDIVTNQGTFQDIPVTLSAVDTNGGTSYKIDLTFKKKEINVTATVTDWTPETGTGEVV